MSSEDYADLSSQEKDHAATNEDAEEVVTRHLNEGVVARVPLDCQQRARRK